MGDSSYHFKDFYIKGKIYNGSYNYTLPSKSGDIALTSDISDTKVTTTQRALTNTYNLTASNGATTGGLVYDSNIKFGTT
jgi:hypothetical protein